MYILKQQPEDFVVTEISNINFKEDGRFVYFLLKKKNVNTLDAVKKIAQNLALKEKQVGFAGSKDKNAITEQVCSAPKIKAERLGYLGYEILGFGDEPISLGDLEGNSFKIIVRHLEKFELNNASFVTNYFDEQRFSIHNVDIGRNIVKKDFKEALKLIDNPRCDAYLEKNENDYVGALKLLPTRLTRLFINAYQSYLWNETVALYLKNKTEYWEVTYSLGKFVFIQNNNQFKDLEVPLIGFGTEELDLNEEIKIIINKLMEKEELDYQDFIIKAIPELSLEGNLRKVFTEIKNLKVGKVENDNLNPGLKKVEVNFSLGKGSYATIVIKKVFFL